jgi:hypothetical protein
MSWVSYGGGPLRKNVGVPAAPLEPAGSTRSATRSAPNPCRPALGRSRKPGERRILGRIHGHTSGFDRIEAVVGEHSWNFADFTTVTTTISGIHAGRWKQEGRLPRDRQPEAAADALGQWWREDPVIRQSTAILRAT